ncbi:MAG: diaminopimelate decarboxylase [Planctomycetota bacterium]|nr:diaminopimelate decarboxylase [Planctomycetota bacterium]
MDLFKYRGGRLYCEDVAVADLAGRYGTPLYVYSAGTLRRHYRRLAAAFAPLNPLICYSVKVCSNIHILGLLAGEGSGFDIVSGGELFRVIAAGGDPSRCCYAGVAKTDAEIRFALEKGIRFFNVESEAELENLARLAAEMGKHPRAALRINPDVDPKTHRHMATGKKETKFGVDLERAERVFRSFAASPGASHVALEAVHLHIGSQITTVEPYVQAVTKALALARTLRGAGLAITALDIGGGFAADYETGDALDAEMFAKALVPLLAGAGLEIIMEPGRFIAGNSGILVTQVQYLKAGGERKFVLVDSGMHHLIRPALYGSYHHIWPVDPGPKFEPRHRTRDEVFQGMELVDVVGPICESTDFFARDRHLPPAKRGDLLAVFSAGAYGMTMASEYNSFPRPAEVLVEGKEARLIRRRGTYEDLIAPEKDV